MGDSDLIMTRRGANNDLIINYLLLATNRLLINYKYFGFVQYPDIASRIFSSEMSSQASRSISLLSLTSNFKVIYSFLFIVHEVYTFDHCPFTRCIQGFK